MQTLTNNAKIDYQYRALGKTIKAATQTNYVTTNISKISINLLKTSTINYFAPGEKIGYSIFISNNSSNPIYNVSVTDHINSKLNYLENSATITNKNGEFIPLISEKIIINSDNQAKESITSGKIEFILDDIDSNETAILSYVVQIPLKEENLPNSIDTYASLYYSTENNLKTEKSSVNSNINSISKAYAMLVAEKLVDKTNAFCGDKLAYTILIKNKGNIDASNVRITDTLPSNFKLEDITFIIADLTYKSTYSVNENNLLTIPANSTDIGLCIPANTSDNSIIIRGSII